MVYALLLATKYFEHISNKDIEHFHRYCAGTRCMATQAWHVVTLDGLSCQRLFNSLQCVFLSKILIVKQIVKLKKFQR